MQPRFGIRTKLLLSILAILLVSYSMLLYSTMITLNSSLATEIDRNLEANLKFARSQYLDDAEIAKYSLQQSALSRDVQQRMRAGDRGWLTQTLKRWHTVLPFLDLMVVLDADKHILARLQGPKNGERLELTGAVDQAIAGKRVIISTEIVPSSLLCQSGVEAYCKKEENGEVLVVTVVLPVIGMDGKVLGVIVGGEIQNRHRYLTDKLKMLCESDVEVTITQGGRTIASSSHDNLLRSQGLPQRVLDTLERDEVFRGETIIGSRKYHTMVDPICNSRGELVGSLSVALACERFKKIRRENLYNIIASAFFGVFCSFAIAFVASRRLTEPLYQLAVGARRIKEGELYQPVEESHDDEIGRLASSFNTMALALKERDRIIARKTADLEELNEQLEKTVERRTSALCMEMGRLEGVLTGMAEGVVVTDRDNRVVLFNPAAQQMFELVPHRVIGQPIELVCKKEGLFPLFRRILELREPGAGSNEVLDVKGKRLQVTLSALADEGGNFAGVVLSIRNVTVEEQIDRMKNDFISTITHELKTPLTAMKGSLQLILNRGKWLTETERTLLTVCSRNTQRLIGLIGEILDISGIESGGMVFKFRPLSIGEVTVFAVEEINSCAERRDITIVNSIPQELPQVLGDHDRLIQVMTNLLANAIKFSPEGALVMVTAKREGNYLRVSVSNRGKAIQWSDRDKLFKKFQQLEGLDGLVGGSGLGLAICKEIIERHHGQIFYTAAKESGNTFCFTVPIIGEGDEKGQDSRC
jgi:PAS domain S-box-containing protein